MCLISSVRQCHQVVLLSVRQCYKGVLLSFRQCYQVSVIKCQVGLPSSVIKCQVGLPISVIKCQVGLPSSVIKMLGNVTKQTCQVLGTLVTKCNIVNNTTQQVLGRQPYYKCQHQGYCLRKSISAGFVSTVAELILYTIYCVMIHDHLYQCLISSSVYNLCVSFVYFYITHICYTMYVNIMARILERLLSSNLNNQLII